MPSTPLEANSVRRDTGGLATATPRNGPLAVLARVALGALSLLLSVNVATGFPLIALWVGSRFAGGDPLSMGAIVIVVVALGALVVMALFGLTWLNAKYDQITGRTPATRQPAPWLLSMRASQSTPTRKGRQVNAVETIVIITVVAAFLALEVWFFFLAGSPLA